MLIGVAVASLPSCSNDGRADIVTTTIADAGDPTDERLDSVTSISTERTETAPPTSPAGQPADTSTVTTPAESSTTLAAGVTLFESPDGRFEVTFSKAPAEQKFDIPGPDGDVVSGSAYLGEIEGGAGIVSCVGVLTDSPDAELLDDARDGALEQLGATFDSEVPVMLQGRSGREFNGTNAGGTVTGRAFIDGDSVCEVVALLVDDAADSTTFLDSFQFSEEAA